MVLEQPQQRALYELLPKQKYAFELIWREGIEQMLYGGAAGGAKSHFVRALAAYLANIWPGSSVGIFRRSDPELRANHVEKWLEEVGPYINGGNFATQKMEYQWPSPAWCWCAKDEPCVHSSITAFRHIDDARGARKHQGTEFAATLLDEATHFKGDDVDFLYTRVRADESKRNAHRVVGPDGLGYDYPGWPGWRKLQVMTSNPGDVGHQYMLENFVEPETGMAFSQHRDRRIVEGPTPLTGPDGARRWYEEYQHPGGEQRRIAVDVRKGQVWTVQIDLGPGRPPVTVKRAFVPASLADNPLLDQQDYAASLAIGSAEQKQRLLDGDWGYSEDKVFKGLQADVHLVDGKRIFGRTATGAMRPPPKSWARAAGQDHGTTKPTAAVWVCREEEGFFVAYQEYYQPGPVGQHIKAIKAIMEWDNHPDLTLWCDPRMSHRNQGVDEQISLMDIYRFGGPPQKDVTSRQLSESRGIKARQARIEDSAALDELFDMLEPDPERLFPDWHPLYGQSGAPMLFITENCRMLWRELANLKHGALDDDGHYSEGIKNGQPDHAFDALKRVAGALRRGIITEQRSGPRYILEAVT